MRGETDNSGSMHGNKNFNPLSSCEERRSDIVLQTLPIISIHSPHARRDSLRRMKKRLQIFQSTLLMRGETSAGYVSGKVLFISIHSPHARRDLLGNSIVTCRKISIHSPHARRDLLLFALECFV